MRFASSPVRSLCAAAAGAMLALSSLSAHAAFASDITLKLTAPGGIDNGSAIDPTPVSAQQTVALADRRATRQFADRVHSLGGYIALDDFGRQPGAREIVRKPCQPLGAAVDRGDRPARRRKLHRLPARRRAQIE